MLSDTLQHFVLPALAACHGAIEAYGPLWVTLFIAGLLGSFTHCVGMCGPFVVSQTVARLEAVPRVEINEFKRLAGAALVPYHLGRLTTYGVLGAIAGGIADSAIHLTGFTSLSSVLLLLAAAIFSGYAVKSWRSHSPTKPSGGSSLLANWLGKSIRPLFARPTGFRGYGLGVALGFLPCGLLYAALSAAAASSGPISGGMAMVAFAVGTVPALFVVSYASHTASQYWRGLASRALPVVLLLNASTLSYLAYTMIA